MIDAFTIYLASFSRRFESQNTRTQFYRDITPNACDVWVKKGTYAWTLQHVHALILPMFCDFSWLCAFCCDASLIWKFVFVLNVFTLLFFDQSFLTFVSKIQKHIKSRKSKKFDRHYFVLSQTCFALYLCAYGFMHLWA